MDMKKIARYACIVGFAVASPWAFAQGMHGGGGGMHGGGAGGGGCGGMGPAMGAGPGPGVGFGAGGGMMDGMMGPGAGMGSGFDMGQGMMGGMMGGAGPYAALNLNEEQQRRMNAIQDNLRKQQWDLQGKVYDEQAKLRDLYAQEQPDPKKVGDVYSGMANLQRQMLELRVQAQNQMVNVLTPDQKQQLSQMRRGTWNDGYGGGPGAGGPGTLRR